MQSRFFVGVIFLFAAILIVFGVGHGFMRHVASARLDRPDSVYLHIQKGASVAGVARQVQQLRIVKEAWHFKLISRWKSLDRSLYAGEYEVLPSDSLNELLQKIRQQDTYKRRLVVPEGASIADIMQVFADSFGLDMTGFVTPSEGSLLPETYFYERGDSANQLVARMQSAMSDAMDTYWRGRAEALPFDTKQQAIILASIVEKETGLSSERAEVAAVFVNRLMRGMRLQSDPTVIYGITKGAPLGRSLSATDLRTDTPFNTYRRGGLPPTPIANPGREALHAVLNPAGVPYLYFVADGTGGHAFATTLAEHNSNVARWRQIEKAKR